MSQTALTFEPVREMKCGKQCAANTEKPLVTNKKTRNVFSCAWNTCLRTGKKACYPIKILILREAQNKLICRSIRCGVTSLYDYNQSFVQLLEQRRARLNSSWCSLCMKCEKMTDFFWEFYEQITNTRHSSREIEKGQTFLSKFSWISPWRMFSVWRSGTNPNQEIGGLWSKHLIGWILLSRIQKAAKLWKAQRTLPRDFPICARSLVGT